jgi:DNA-binding MarR family transcriptional regulator
MQSRFESEHHEAMLSLLVAASAIRESLDRVCGEHAITRGQYNVLRILQANPAGFSRGEIARRLVERSPDVTRLIDRLEQRGLIERRESEQDRRLSLARITRKGQDLLEEMEPDVQAVEARLASLMSADEAAELTRLCERIFARDGNNQSHGALARGERRRCGA